MLQIVSFGLSSPSGPGFKAIEAMELWKPTRWLFCTITHVVSFDQWPDGHMHDIHKMANLWTALDLVPLVLHLHERMAKLQKENGRQLVSHSHSYSTIEG